MRLFKIFLLSIVLLFSACRRDMEIIDNQFIPITGGELIASQLTGQVVDQTGQPIIDATVKFEQLEATTNEDGVFSFTRLDLESNGQLLVVEKEGFFTNYKKITPIENQTFQRIGLVTKAEPTGNFSATNGGVIEKPDGEKITFKPNSIRTETEENYLGPVTVFTHHFNPEGPFFHETMPGDLSAIDHTGSMVQLATYSMILVELYGENGERLNLKENSTATVEFPIKGDAINSAPDFIPLWSLDENTSTWVEESQATKQGDYYIGEVSHFSFWNCDVPFDLVNLEGTIIDLDGNPIANQRVSIEIVNGGSVRSTYTNPEGKFTGSIPKNELLILKVFNLCGIELLFAENIGPFGIDQNFTFSVENIENSVLLTGSLNNCTGESVENGYVVAERNSGLKEIIPINSEGNFSYHISNCLSGDFTIYGIDRQTFNKSPELNISYTGQDSEDIGTLVACDELATYFSLSVNGVEEFLLDESAEHGNHIENDDLMILLQSSSIDGFVYMVIPNPSLGENNPSEIMIESSNFDKGCNDNFFPCLGNFTIELIKFENFLGGYVEGTASGELSDDNGNMESVNMEFRIQLVNILSDYSGIIWEDLNENGIRDTDEPGVGGNILIEYLSPSISGGLPIKQEKFPNSNGLFTIPISELNNGFITIDLPTGYRTTLQNQGNDEALDSDFPQNAVSLDFPIEDMTTPNLLDIGIHLE